MYLGAAFGGLWRSTDFNTEHPTWVSLLDSDPANGYGIGSVTSIGTIVVDPENGRNIYVGTGQANVPGAGEGVGILRSTDGGDTWTVSRGPLLAGAGTEAFFGMRVSSILIDPRPGQQNHVFAAVSDDIGATRPRASSGVYESNDSGVTWAQITSGDDLGLKLAAGIDITDLDYTYSTRGALTLYAGVQGGPNSSGNQVGGLFVGTFDGTAFNWGQAALPGITDNSQIDRIRFASERTRGAQNIYAAVTVYRPGTRDVDSFQGVFESTNSGASWVGRANPGNVSAEQGFYSLAVGLAPSGRLYLGGVTRLNDDPQQLGLFESDPSVATWRNIDIGANNITPHTDDQAWAFGSDGTVYLGTDGGIYRYRPTALDPEVFTSQAISGVNGIGVGDFNGDGIADVAVANNDQVTIRFGSGQNSFSTSVFGLPTRAPGVAVAVAAGHLFSSTNLDLAVISATQDQGTLTLFQGDGTGAFFFRRTISISGEPTSVAINDLNGDGTNDIIVTSRNGRISIFEGLPDGTFQLQAPIPQSGLTPVQVAIGDFSGDDAPDLVVAGGYGPPLSYLRNQAQGVGNAIQFATAVSLLNAPAGPQVGVVSGDFDGDGKVDFAVALPNSHEVRMFWGSGDGPPFLTSSLPVSGAPIALVAADFDGDGQLDLAVLSNTTTVHILYNLGHRGFQTAAPVSITLQHPATKLTVGDITGDGRRDLIAISPQGLSLIGTNSQAPARGRGTWDNLNTAGLNTIEANSVALSPTNRNILLEAAQDNGIGRTANGVAVVPTWNAVQWGDGVMVRFDTNSPTGSVVYALGQDGAFSRSNDGGVTFTSKPAADESLFPFYARMAVDPNNAGVVVLGGKSGKLFETRDGGDSWLNISPVLTVNPAMQLVSGVVTALAFAPSRSQTFYVGYDDGTLLRTTDNAGIGTTTQGQSSHWFKPDGLPWGNTKITAIAVSSTNPDVVVVAVNSRDSKVYESDDGGQTWTDQTNALPSKTLVTSLAVDGNRLYAGTDAGVFLGDNTTGAINWTKFGDGLPLVAVKDIQISHYSDGRGVMAISTTSRGVWTIPVAALPGVAVGGFAWNDANQNGLDDTGESGVGGVGVTLIDSTGNPVDSTVTDLTGHYVLSDVQDGQYSIDFSLPSGSRFTTQVSNGSIVNPTSGQSDIFTVSGQSITDLNVGMVPDRSPIAQDDSFTFDRSKAPALHIAANAPGLLGNDSDPDGDHLTVEAVNGEPGLLGSPIELSSGAELTVMADGSFTYSAPDNVFGTDLFTYTISDGYGGFSTANVFIDTGVKVTLFNTGVDDSGAPLADNIADSHYSIEPGAPLAGSARTITADGFPIGPWVANNAGSRWITPQASDDNGDAPPGTYTYKTTFDLTGLDPSTAVINGTWAADDSAEIFLDGQDTGIGVTGYAQLTPFTIRSGFVPGLNYLEFVVTNGPGDPTNPTGLRVSNISGTALPGGPLQQVQVYNTGVDNNGNPLPDNGTSQVTGLYNTGVDSGGTVLGQGGVDASHFTIVAAPDAKYLGSTMALTSGGGFPIGPWASDDGASRWITSSHADDMQADAAPGLYDYQTSFNVADPSQVILSGKWAADDSAEIWLNGVDTGLGVTGFSSLQSFVLTTGFVAGTNTLDFKVTNGVGGATPVDNPTGLRVEFDTMPPASDPHYRVLSSGEAGYGNPPAGVAGQTKVIAADQYPFPYWTANDSTSRWIAPAATDSHGDVTPGVTIYRTTFDLTGYDPSTAVLTGEWAADNQGLDIILNGVAMHIAHGGTLTPSGVEGYNWLSQFVLRSGFVQGINTLDFVVQNDPLAPGDATANPAGLRVDHMSLWAAPTMDGASMAAYFAQQGDGTAA